MVSLLAYYVNAVQFQLVSFKLDQNKVIGQNLSLSASGEKAKRLKEEQWKGEQNWLHDYPPKLDETNEA